MARLYVFVEGQTEQTFVHTLLFPHLMNFGVHHIVAIQIAHARRKGVVHRGGGRSYKPMKDDIARTLRQHKSNDVFFTTMIDLYAIAPDFPGLAEVEKFRSTPLKKVEALEQFFGDDLSDNRFIPYIQLHEYEAFLFSDTSKFRSEFPNHEKAISELTYIAARYDSPEDIDEGRETAPSKRIIKAIPEYEGRKASAGPNIAAEIGIQAIRIQCPHFNSWLLKLETLG